MSIVRKCPFLKLFKTLLIMRRYYLLVYLFISYANQGGAIVNVTLTPLQKAEGFNKTFEESREFMRYCDTDAPIYDHDEFMDRIASINIRDTIIQGEPRAHQIIVTGIFINSNHILTSYTPFIDLFEHGVRDLNKMYFQFYPHKWFGNDNLELKQKGYALNRGNLLCGRRVYPVPAEIELSRPAPCDLMVFRTQDYSFYEDGWNYFHLYRNISYTDIGPQVTDLAGENDEIGDKFKIVSLGMIDNDHVYNRNHLHTVEMDKHDNVIQNCDEWHPFLMNPWICILNVEHHVAIGSGAFLISKNKVFGVGSFTIYKDSMSIHVFTDVRALRDVIDTTCTVYDGYGYAKYDRV